MESKLYLNTDKYFVTFKKLTEENDKFKQYFIEVLICGKMIEKPIDSLELKQPKKIILENYNDYTKLNVKNIDKEWIYNIIDHKAESNDIIFEDKNMILIPDYKWDKTLKNLHILAIFKDKSLGSIRDLSSNNIEALVESVENGKKIIMDNYGIDNLIVYFHYRPSVWQLHMHFTNLDTDNKDSFLLPRAHLANTVIQNLKNDSEFYRNAVLEVLI
jgi:m7GpppX diphosphatase